MRKNATSYRKTHLECERELCLELSEKNAHRVMLGLNVGCILGPDACVPQELEVRLLQNW